MHRLVTWLALSVVFMRPPPMEASWADWPLERILENLNKRLAEDSTDAAAHYNLGRAYAFAFALERSTLLVYTLDVVHLKDHEDQVRYGPTPPGDPPPPTPERKLELLTEGLSHLRRSIELADNAQKRLTLGWLLESGAHLADRVDTAVLLGSREALSSEERERFSSLIDALGSDLPEVATSAMGELEKALPRALALLQARSNSANPQRQAAIGELLTRFWCERAIEEFWSSFEQAARDEEAEDMLLIEHGTSLDSRLVHEALSSYRRLVLARGARSGETERLAEAEKRLAELDKKPRSVWITPLLLSLREGCPTLDELTLPNLAVPFDLDGDAIMELWPWLAPDAGWLVWDPEQRGEITSGLQLFGSASAWLFFADGYRVLDALDDDRDGELRNQELTGIAVWFDRDTDGVSDPGEVMPVEELGLVALATEATERIGPSLGNQAGAELADGRRLPTYDWVLSPAQPSAQQ